MFSSSRSVYVLKYLAPSGPLPNPDYFTFQEILVPVTLILVSWAMKEITKNEESKGLPSELTEEEIAFNFPTVPVAWDSAMEVWDNRFEIFGVLNSYGKVVCL